MGQVNGFLEIQRKPVVYRQPAERIKDFSEFHIELKKDDREKQGARCMDCGVPFCHSSFGCPVHNLIPEFNDLIYKGKWKEAFFRLKLTNNFPEFTGRVCPAPCESACVLGINEPAVTIKDNERAIIDEAYAQGLMKPHLPEKRSGKTVAIVGSGPAGLAAADELNMAGHKVTVFERSDKIGGLLMYGIPNMKLEKTLVDRRVEIMSHEGVDFQPNTTIGEDIKLQSLMEEYDSVLLATGSTIPRDLPIPGRDAKGVHFAMNFLTANTKNLLGIYQNGSFIDAKGKKVIVIGGGDTGNDCIGTSVRHGAASVINFELMPKPPKERDESMPWPTYPRLQKQDYGHKEAEYVYGNDPREYSILSKEFVKDDQGCLKGIKTVRVQWEFINGRPAKFTEVPGSEEYWEADLVFLAMGFLGPDKELIEGLDLEQDTRSNFKAEYGKFATNIENLFSAGDARRGQSLVVWAINEGRGAARAIDIHLMGESAIRFFP
jgi:glutamate synthase (NADPH/NADH) small chain